MQLRSRSWWCVLLVALASGCNGFVAGPYAGRGSGREQPPAAKSSIKGRCKRVPSLYAMAVDQSEFARAELARKQQEYEASLKERLREQARSQTSASDKPPALADLPLIPYIGQDGKLSDAGVNPKVKASAYAILDQDQVVQYIGVSRNVAQSLRLQLARMPEQTYFFKVHHITKPNRAILEAAKQVWIDELGGAPAGNDEGPVQALWEGPLDVKPLMTAEDHALIEAAREKQRPEEGAMKKIARRYENEKIKILEARGVTESTRFDPKLKGQGLLDLYLESVKPNDAVPS